MTPKDISKETVTELLSTLKKRFEDHAHRHEDIGWNEVEEKLNDNHDKLWSLNEMERTGGEPDVVKEEKGVLIFMN